MGSGLRLAVGLMSGTSMDGVDAALIETDGDKIVRPIGTSGGTAVSSLFSSTSATTTP